MKSFFISSLIYTCCLLCIYSCRCSRQEVDIFTDNWGLNCTMLNTEYHGKINDVLHFTLQGKIDDYSIPNYQPKVGLLFVKKDTSVDMEKIGKEIAALKKEKNTFYKLNIKNCIFSYIGDYDQGNTYHLAAKQTYLENKEYTTYFVVVNNGHVFISYNKNNFSLSQKNNISKNIVNLNLEKENITPENITVKVEEATCSINDGKFCFKLNGSHNAKLLSESTQYNFILIKQGSKKTPLAIYQQILSCKEMGPIEKIDSDVVVAGNTNTSTSSFSNIIIENIEPNYFDENAHYHVYAGLYNPDKKSAFYSEKGKKITIPKDITIDIEHAKLDSLKAYVTSNNNALQYEGKINLNFSGKINNTNNTILNDDVSIGLAFISDNGVTLEKIKTDINSLISKKDKGKFVELENCIVYIENKKVDLNEEKFNINIEKSNNIDLSGRLGKNYQVYAWLKIGDYTYISKQAKQLNLPGVTVEFNKKIDDLEFHGYANGDFGYCFNNNVPLQNLYLSNNTEFSPKWNIYRRSNSDSNKDEPKGEFEDDKDYIVQWEEKTKYTIEIYLYDKNMNVLFISKAKEIETPSSHTKISVKSSDNPSEAYNYNIKNCLILPNKQQYHIGCFSNNRKEWGIKYLEKSLFEKHTSTNIQHNIKNFPYYFNSNEEYKNIVNEIAYQQKWKPSLKDLFLKNINSNNIQISPTNRNVD